jgi:hypothetical protein
MKLKLVIVLCISISTMLPAASGGSKKEDNRVAKGLEISPVPLRLNDRNKTLVGIGSYLVNASAGCATCHTCPTFVPGHEKGKNKQINAQNYMAGAVPFVSATSPGPAIHLSSPNLTPDVHGLPGGLTFTQFQNVFTEGHRTLAQAYSEVPPASDGYTGEISVMPWRIYQNLPVGDLEAIYEYLKAIPPAKPGTCSGPGE